MVFVKNDYLVAVSYSREQGTMPPFRSKKSNFHEKGSILEGNVVYSPVLVEENFKKIFRRPPPHD